MKLNYKVWRTALDSAKTADEKTELLCIRAHITGKIHRHRARLDWKTLHTLGKKTTALAWLLAHTGGTEIVDLNEEDQAKLLLDVEEKVGWYLKQEPVAVSANAIK